MRLYIFIFLTIGILFSGCNHPVKPSWIDAVPNANQALGILGPQRENSFTTQKRIALLKAKAELSKRIQLKLYSELLLKSSCQSHSCQKSLYSLSVQKSQAYLNHAKEVDSYLDPTDGTYYLLIEIKQ